MQWDSSANGGFTSAAKPWLAENPNYKEINAAEEVSDPDSVYNYTRKAIALRHAHEAFVYGDYKDLAPDDKAIFAYTRTLGAERFLVVLNFSETPNTFTLPADLKVGPLLLSNLAAEQHGEALHLAGWEARVYKLQ